MQSILVQVPVQSAKILIDVGDHAKKTGLVGFDLVSIRIPAVIRHPQRTVGRIGGDIG